MIPVVLYGRLGDEPFHENTETIDVCQHGGLVAVSVKIMSSQKLIVTNIQTDEDATCRVARLVQAEKGRILAGLEFLEPSSGFWGTILAPSDQGSGEQTRS